MAKIGKALTGPETGWKRYDDSISHFIYTGAWSTSSSSIHYNSIIHLGADNTSKVSFNFIGSQIRIIAYTDDTRSNSLAISIDGVIETFSEVGPSAGIAQCLVYEKQGLAFSNHSVSISNNTTTRYTFDAVDIDLNGILYLNPPATTGQFRNKVSDMEIGDYIACEYTAASGGTGTFSKLVTTSAAELALTGVAAPSGSFYFVKVNKGLLIADRVIQNTITWDKLNTDKRIQGFSWSSNDVVPAMTSNTTPSGVISASSVYNGNYAPWKAFNGDYNTDQSRWLAGAGGPAWLQYDFGVGNEKIIQGYTIISGLYTAASPKNWTFEASNTGEFAGEQVILDTQTNQTSWAASTKQIYSFVNNTPYRFYRINITANNGNTSYFTAIEELEMVETAGIIRSLTGGVAYADANGNSSTTDKNIGGWPTNNEWDRFIVNFPADTIQLGKVLDDVFHWTPIRSWCQDTPMSGTTGASGFSSTNASRILRGMTINQSALWGSVSSTSNTTGGFRPVFEYKE